MTPANDKATENGCSSSEDEYRVLFENTGTAMSTINADGVFLRCNSQFCSLCGYTADELVNKMSWSDFVDEKDLTRMRAYHARRESSPSTTPADYTFTFVTRSGERKLIHVFVRLVPQSGQRVCSLLDVTGREETLEALRRSKERYALVAKGANDGFWDWDLVTNEVWFSERYKEILGYSGDEFPNTLESWTGAVHPDDNDHAMEENRRCLEGEVDQFEVEYRMLHKDGTVRWILGRGASVRDENGKIHRMAGTHTDITARKFTERTNSALYAISSAVTTTRDLRGLYETIHGIIDEALDADNFFITLLNEEQDSLEFVYFSDEKDDYSTIQNVSDPAKNSLSIHVFRTGTPLLLSVSSPEDVAHMNRIGILGTLPESWLGVPLRLRGRTVGAMAVQDYDDPRHYSEVDVKFMTAVSEQVALAIERKRGEEELEMKVDLRTRELRQKAAELEEANARLLELDQIKSSLVSSVSHELRTPLTSIRGFAKLCLKDFRRHFTALTDTPMLETKAARIRDNLGIIETEGERLTRLINDFLDINRIESGKACWHDRLLDPCEIIRKAISAASGSFCANTDVQVRMELPAACRPIHADPDKIQQVVINLLHNAYKFTREGSVTVSLTENESVLTTKVIDTGIGIAEADLPNLFEVFHKSSCGDTIMDENQGTGLGLAICKEIVEHYGGSIWADSTLGKGSTFTFSLPFAWL